MVPVVSAPDPVVKNTSNSPAVFTLRPVSQAEVLKALSHLDPKKSKGEDDLDPYLLHLSARSIADPFTFIFNLTFSSGKIPPVWKAAQVVPLFKGGDTKAVIPTP